MVQNNILVVEDEELMRSILRQLLEVSGHRVFTADSAENALEIFAANDIALTLTECPDVYGSRASMALTIT